MNNLGITIVIPVGPQPAYKAYLKDCIDSVTSQMEANDQIILIDDQAHLDYSNYGTFVPWKEWAGEPWRDWPYQIYRTPWLIGCADGWNFGVSLSANNWILLMGSDDKLLPGCLAACREVISNKPDPLGYYNFTCVNDKGEEFDWFNNAAMVSKALWRYTGGYGPSAFASPDGWLISIMYKHMPEHLHQLKHRTPLYWCRTHSEQDTLRMAAFFHGEVISIRNKETERFQPNPEWAQLK